MITFQVISSEIHDGSLADYAQSTIKGNYLGRNSESKFTISLFGTDENGNSTVVHVNGIRTYFAIRDDGFLDIHNLAKVLRKSLCVIDSEGNWSRFEKDITISSKPEKRKSNYYYRDKCDDIYYVYCKNLWAYNKCRWKLQNFEKDHSFTVVDKKVDPRLKFFGDNNFKTSGWFSFDETKCFPCEKQTTRENEYTIDFKDLIYHSDRSGMNKKTNIATFDIEVYSVDGSFPKPEIKENVCFNIALSHSSGGIIQNYEWYYPETIAQSGSILTNCASEKELLLSFSKHFGKVCYDVIITYNGHDFDYRYLFKRAEIVGCYDEFCANMSQVYGFSSYISEESFSSSARGSTDFKRPKLLGVFDLDLLTFISSDVTKKYDTYSLFNVAKEIIGDTKIDLPAAEIFRLYKENKIEGHAKISEYCLRDIEVTRRVAEKDVSVEKLIAMSNLTGCICSDIIVRGQGIKTLSALYRAHKNDGFYLDNIWEKIPTNDKGENLWIQAGGHVFEATLGMFADPTVIVDFKSLYPSVMAGYFLDYSTMWNPKFLSKETIENPPETFTLKGIHPNTNLPIEYTTVQGTNTPTIKYIYGLWKARQDIKKLMKTEIDPTQMSIYKSEEQAIKVTMNSIYGSTNGLLLPMINLAESITLAGRISLIQAGHFTDNGFIDYLRETNNLPNEKFTTKVIYGDTDSNFVLFKNSTEEEAKKYGDILAEHISNVVINRPPIELENEATYLRMIQRSKKDYISVLRNEKTNNFYLSYKGGSYVKRSYTKWFKRVYNILCETILLKFDDLHPLLIQGNDYLPFEEVWQPRSKQLGKNMEYDHKTTYLPSKEDMERNAKIALKIFELSCRTLISGKVPNDLLKSTVSLKNDYKNRKTGETIKDILTCPIEELPNIHQVQLARRMNERDSGSSPPSGSRFEYMLVKNLDLPDKKCFQTEKLDYIIENNIPIDYVAYLKKDFNDVIKLFKVCNLGNEAIKIMEHWTKETKRLPKGQQTMNSFFKSDRVIKDKKDIYGLDISSIETEPKEKIINMVSEKTLNKNMAQEIIKKKIHGRIKGIKKL